MTERPTSHDLAALDAKINALLPPRYRGNFLAVSPDSMGSAGLKYGPGGKVAWNEIWTSFCDLALAGGPPHRGTLLEPRSLDRATADVQQSIVIAQEIARAFRMVTGLPVVMEIGWVGVVCGSETMAAWLAAAITAENVSTLRKGASVLLPSGPEFRLEKEVKNVVVALAKTCHYWSDHQPEGAAQFDLRDAITPPLASTAPDDNAAKTAIAAAVHASTGWPCDAGRYFGWVGISCPDTDAAVWLMRAIIVEGVLARREGQVLYIAAGSGAQDQTSKVIAVWEGASRLWSLSYGG